MHDKATTKDQLIKELEEMRHQVAALKERESIHTRVEAELQESEQRLAEIIDFLPDATFAVDKDGKVIAWNRAIEEMTGVKASDILGKGDYEYSIPFYGVRRPILIDLIFISDEETAEKYTFVKREGGVLLAEGYVPLRGVMRALWGKASPLYDSKGTIAGAIEAIRDITERKRAEEEIRESRQLFADIINFLPDATFVIDKEGKVIAWNRAIEEMTGVRAEDMLGKGSHEYAIPFYGAKRPILIDLVQTSDEEIEKKYTITKKKKDVLIGEADFPSLRGERRILWGKASPIYDSQGNVVGAIETIRDVTERKQAEEALREAHDKLEQRVKERTADLNSANEDIKKFTYIVSHDMRAPLINLKGFANELYSATAKIESAVGELIPFMNAEKQKEIFAALHEDVPEALEFIDISVTRMDNLINSILKLSRLGRRELKFESINMNNLVNGILKSIAHQIEIRHARIFVEPLPEVTADCSSMEQVMGNLLDNAIKYRMPDRAGEIRIWGNQEDEFTTFHIQDNGRGIAEKDMPKIFNIFSRVGSQDVPGDGMGLTYVQAMVKRHGGHIRCTSEPGMGTTFSFTISTKLASGGDYEP